MNLIKLLIFTVLAILMLEYISKKNLKKVLMLKPYALMVNVLILLDLILLLNLVTQGLQVTLMIITVIIIFWGIANRIKLDYRQTGFTPLDFLILREAISMAGALNKKSMGQLVVTAFLSFLFLTIMTISLNQIYMSNNIKVIIIIISLIMPLMFYFLGPKYNHKISVFEIGTIFYFLSYFNNPPKIRINKRKRNLKALNSDFKNGVDKPDVIIIQSESFIDPYVLGVDKFNKDPLPFYRSLVNESYSFSMSTRAFGGGTVHTEYEILTGLSTVFFPRDTTVFSRYIKEALPSIGSILNKQGYQSVLIHPYLEWYYNRTRVYKKLGFDKFLSLKSFENPTENYVKDIDVFDRILQHLDEGNNLIVAVTMQNHTPYYNHLYKNGVEFLGNFSNPDTKTHFNHFLNGLAETDDSLSKLIEQLKNRDKETILLFYGDHLPVINQDAAFYEESLWSQAEFDSRKYYYDLSQSPGLIWSNKKNIKHSLKNIDATAVLPILLEEINCKYPDYIKSLGNILDDNKIYGLFRDYMIKDGEYYDCNHQYYQKIYKDIKGLNTSAFNDAKYDEWCYESVEYEVK